MTHKNNSRQKMTLQLLQHKLSYHISRKTLSAILGKQRANIRMAQADEIMVK